MPIKVEEIARFSGKTVVDEYGRDVGVLVSFYSSVEGVVEAVEVKIVDRGIERVPAERLKISDGKLIVTPEWKYKALKVIEALDRAYRRKRAIDTLAGQGDLPADVVEGMKRRLNEEIKKLKVEADKVRRMVKDRINKIDDEHIHLAGAIASLQMLYFSNEIDEAGYVHAINHLRRLREGLAEEKADAKKVLDKLEKTLEAATMGAPAPAPRKEPKHAPAPVKAGPPSPPAAAPKAQDEVVFVKVED